MDLREIEGGSMDLHEAIASARATSDGDAVLAYATIAAMAATAVGLAGVVVAIHLPDLAAVARHACAAATRWWERIPRPSPHGRGHLGGVALQLGRLGRE